MQLHQLRKTYKERKKKRIGRGGKRGTMSGRGQKGQKSRAGRKMRPGLRELIIRLPKKKGISNPTKSDTVKAVNLSVLESKFESGTIINSELLRASGLIRKEKRVKILGDGNITKSFRFGKEIEFSESARKKIEAAGGKIGEEAK